ncbi:MAG: hypothetical protein H6585_08450 [Flavobacteriales bacterium]|nr:hypothetical protein [Flavobacteriales bacterium]MCB9448359.1 hypothetical protein [Flavobacteriales bacterium]
MKRKLLVAGLACLAWVQGSQAQTVFTVKPGLNLNGVNVGYKTGIVEPFVGLQFANIMAKSTYTNTSEDVIKAHLYMPSVGARVFVLDQGPLKGAFSASFFKPVISGESTTDTTFQEDIKHVSVWGCELGFGMEYFFDEHFSVGGEYGYRAGFFRHTYSTNSNEDILHVNMSYVSVSLNFYINCGQAEKKEKE